MTEKRIRQVVKLFMILLSARAENCQPIADQAQENLATLGVAITFLDSAIGASGVE